MTQVHTPYHFVPLSRWVYMPEWAHLVSHDHPFEDGLSGQISYTLINQTSLCVGEVQQKATKTTPGKVAFSTDSQGTPIIPNTSLKGAIRDVLEIASFCKFNQIDDPLHTFRDVRDKPYTDKATTNPLQAAWLKFDAKRNEWTLRNCSFVKLYYDVLKKDFVTNCSKLTAKNKYEEFPLDDEKSLLRFNLATRELFNTKGELRSYEHAYLSDEGEKTGWPAFVGFRPAPKESQASLEHNKYSYVFYDPEQDMGSYKGVDQAVQQYLSAHNRDTIQFLLEHPHPELGIPVFIRHNKGEISAIGVATMPKLNYKHSVKSIAKLRQKGLDDPYVFDMAELIFGSLRDKDLSLKSRVTFSDAICTKNQTLFWSEAMILNSPESSYYPAYLEQLDSANGIVKDGKFNTYDNYNIRNTLKGRKRYPPQEKFEIYFTDHKLKSTYSIQSCLQLINPESQFSGTIVFHNLKPEELGAVLWALSLGGNEKLCHTIGHGKPYGAGSVKFSGLQLKLAPYCNQTHTVRSLIGQFENNMLDNYPSEETSWSESTQIKHLISLCDPVISAKHKLKYMKLESYTSSKQKEQSRYLADWDSLERTEPRLEFSYTEPKGRLSHLLDKQEPSEKNSSMNQSAKKEEKEPSLPHYARELYRIRDLLISAPDDNAKKQLNGVINNLILDAKTTQWEKIYLEELVAMLEDEQYCPRLSKNNQKKRDKDIKKLKAKLEE